MFYAVVERARFSDVLTNGERLHFDPLPTLLRPHRGVEGLHPLSCLCIYERRPATPTQLPDLLVTVDGHERDWLAWLSTFAQNHRPFTAFCRVMGLSDAARHFEATSPERPLSLRGVEGACVGLILGELLSSDEILARMRENLPAWVPASTLSQALVREIVLYGSALNGFELVDRWMRTRGLTRQRERLVDVGGVLEILAAIDVVSGRDARAPVHPGIVRVLDEISSDRPRLEGRPRSAEFFPLLAAFGIDPERDTREERVAKFEAAVGAVRDRGTPEAGFLLGYLASRINPGTLLHAGLLAPALREHPSAMLWYGVCAGFAGPQSILGSFGGLGRRILRELYAPHGFLYRPTADLAIGELEVMLQDRPDDPPEFVAGSASHLSVELDAGITTTVSWSRNRKRSDERLAPADLLRISEDVRRLRNAMVHDLGSAIEPLIRLYNRLDGERNREPEANRGAARHREPEAERVAVLLDRGGGRDGEQAALPLGPQTPTKPDRRGSRKR